MPYSRDDYVYGPVFVLKGRNKGRIGYLDDEETVRGQSRGIVYFGEPLMSRGYFSIPMNYLSLPNTQQLLRRHEEISVLLLPYTSRVSNDARITLLEELSLVVLILYENMIKAKFHNTKKGAKIFLSHSSIDKAFVRGLATDLAAAGHQPWLDEWEILAGESIVERVGEGLEEADFVIVVLSRNAVASSWVEQEWQAKYWDEISQRKLAVIPIVIDDCAIPMLLKTKKYIDFRSGYDEAIEDLVRSVTLHHEKKK